MPEAGRRRFACAAGEHSSRAWSSVETRVPEAPLTRPRPLPHARGISGIRFRKGPAKTRFAIGKSRSSMTTLGANSTMCGLSSLLYRTEGQEFAGDLSRYAPGIEIVARCDLIVQGVW